MSFKPIIPKKPKLEDFKLLVKAVEKTIDKADKEFAKTYKTFGHKPDFVKALEEGKAKIVGSTTTSGEGSRRNPYPFIVKGTSVRYATMTPDFKAKTKPRVIGSGSGAGGVAYIDTRRPREGIEAREFDLEIAKQAKPKFVKNVKAAMRQIRKRSGHSI